VKKILAAVVFFVLAVIVAGPSAEAASCTGRPSGLVSWWTADDNARDIIGSNSGTLMGGTTYGQGKFGQAFNFDGVDDYVRVPNSANLNMNDAITISIWINPSGGSTGNGAILMKEPLIYGLIRIPGTQKVTFSLDTGAGWVDNWSNGVVPPDQWTHIAATYDGANVKIYINGVLDAESPRSGSLKTGSGDLILGSYIGGAQYFNGLIDEGTLFNRALDATEIATLYNGGSVPICRPACALQPADLLAWWRAEGNGQDIIGANDGTLINGATFADGRVGKALSFDGVDDYVVTSYTQTAVEAYSVSAWVKTNDSSVGNKAVVQNRGSEFGMSLTLGLGSGAAFFTLDSYDLQIGTYTARAINDGLWHHVVGTWAAPSGTAIAPDQFTIYVDGIAEASTAGAYHTATSPLTGLGGLEIGHHGSWGTFFSGLIDEVQIFNRALSPAEVQSIYSSGSTGLCISFTCAAAPSGLVSLWPADGNPNDIIGSNGGTLMNGATFAPGKVGQAFSFDGVDDYVSVPSSSSLDITSGDFTIESWIYRSVSGGPGAGIIGKLAPDNSGWAFAVYDDRLNLFCNQWTEGSSGTVSANAWSHVAVTRSGSLLTYYINGVSSGSFAASGNFDNGLPLSIGDLYSPNISNTHKFNGLIDEPAIYNRALTPQEIRNIYNAGSKGTCKPSCVAPPSGLVSWWNGEGNANDPLGTNNGVIQPGATFSNGKVGESFSFGGSSVNDRIQVTSPVGLPSGSAARTMMFWFKTPGIWPSGSHIPIEYGSPALGGKFGILFAEYWIGKMSFWGYSRDFPGNTTLQPNTWYHGAVSYDGTIVRLYVNGQPDGSQVMSLNTGVGSYGLTIGASVDAGAPWSGPIDEIQIFDHALSDSEILSVYNAGSAGFCNTFASQTLSGIIGWWPGNGNGNDIVGGNDGTLLNHTSYAPGMVGQSFSFDGVDDYILVSDNPSLNITGDVTVGLWAKRDKLDSYSIMLSKGAGSISGIDVPSAYVLQFNESNVLMGGFEDASGANYILSGPVVTDTNLHHYAYARSGSSHKLFMDGVVVANAVFAAAPGNTSGIDLSIGGVREGSGFVDYFGGLIDEVQIYNRALSDTEVQSIYNARSAGMVEPDMIPDQFEFTPVELAQTSTQFESNRIAVIGIDYPSPISITNGEYLIFGQAWTSIQGVVNPGSSVMVRQTSAASYGATTSAVLTVGGVSGVFNVKTIPQYTVSGQANPPEGGAVDCSAAVQGALSLCTITANPHYHVVSVTTVAGCGNGTFNYPYSPGTGSSGTTSLAPFASGQVVEDCTVMVQFALDSYTVQGSVSTGNGSIGCDTPVAHGQSSTCTLYPDTAWHASALTDNDGNVAVPDNSQYIIQSVAGNHTVRATYSEYPVQRVSSSMFYYMTIQLGYNAADSTGADTIKAFPGPFINGLNCDKDVSVTLRGGFGSGFQDNPGVTAIYGGMTIGKGTVEVDKIELH